MKHGSFEKTITIIKLNRGAKENNEKELKAYRTEHARMGLLRITGKPTKCSFLPEGPGEHSIY